MRNLQKNSPNCWGLHANFAVAAGTHGFVLLNPFLQLLGAICSVTCDSNLFADPFAVQLLADAIRQMEFRKLQLLLVWWVENDSESAWLLGDKEVLEMIKT